MKRILFFALCIGLLLLAGCSTVNQSNRFVELSPAQVQQTPEVTESAAPQTPAPTQIPAVQLVVEPVDIPTDTPEASQSPVPTAESSSQPEATVTPAPQPTPTPAGSPGGFNG